MLFLQKFYFPAFSAVILLCFGAMPGFAASRTSTRGGVEIVFMDKSQTEDHPAVSYLEKLDAEVMRVLHYNAAVKPSVPLRIEVLPHFFPENFNVARQGNVTVLQVSANIDDLIEQRSAQRVFGAYLLLAKANIRPEFGFRLLPEFISDGIHAIIRDAAKRQTIIKIPYFPGLRAVRLAKQPCNLRTLLTYSKEAAEADGAVLAFYDEAARFMVESLDVMYGNGRDPLGDFIALSCKEQDFDTVFEATFGSILRQSLMFKLPESLANADAKMQLDYLTERFLDSRLFSNYMPLPPKIQQQRFKEFRQITYRLPEQEQLFTADITELPAIIDEYPDLTPLILPEKMIQLSELRKVSSLVAEPEFGAVADALQNVGG